MKFVLKNEEKIHEMIKTQLKFIIYNVEALDKLFYSLNDLAHFF